MSQACTHAMQTQKNNTHPNLFEMYKSPWKNISLPMYATDSLDSSWAFYYVQSRWMEWIKKAIWSHCLYSLQVISGSCISLKYCFIAPHTASTSSLQSLMSVHPAFSIALQRRFFVSLPDFLKIPCCENVNIIYYLILKCV